MLHRIALQLVALTIAAATTAGAPINAQEPERRTAQAPGRGARANAQLMSPAEAVNMLDAYALVQAHETRRRGQQERNRILRELRQLAGPQGPSQPDENALR